MRCPAAAPDPARTRNQAAQQLATARCSTVMGGLPDNITTGTDRTGQLPTTIGMLSRREFEADELQHGLHTQAAFN